MAESINGLLQHARSELVSSQTPALDAEVLLQHCVNKDRAWLMAHGDAQLDEVSSQRFRALVRRRRRGEPVAYLTGYREFWSLRLKINADVLVPRQETEVLVEQALARIPEEKSLALLDLGTGSGAVALAIANDRPLCQLTATDNTAAALRVAADNACRLSIGNVSFCHGHWYQAVGGQRFDLIVSNPPYVAEDDPHLQRGDLPREPRAALCAGARGMRDLNTIIAGAPQHLTAAGWLLLEHGPTQADAVRAAMAKQGLVQIATVHDLSGHPRVTLAQANGSGTR